MTLSALPRPSKSTNVRVALSLAGVVALGILPPVVHAQVNEPAARHDAAIHYHASVLLRDGAAFAEQGRWEDARRAFARAVDLNPGLASARFDLGITLVALGRVNDALDAYQEALRLESTFVPAMVNIGVELSKLRRYDAAISYLQRAIRTAPGFALAHLDLGVVLAEQGRQQEALIALEKAARLSPDDVAVKQALADTHYNIGVKLDQ